MPEVQAQNILEERSRASARRLRQKPTNPIELAIKLWAERLPHELLPSLSLSLDLLLSSAPKRWVVYPPLVLLPSGTFGSGWDAFLSPTSSTSQEYSYGLWRHILQQISHREGKGSLTHLAANSGIPHFEQESALPREQEAAIQGRKENILRTPSGLITLYGDFGPALHPSTTPSPKDFEDAFWVSTKQNGITQVWAPRYTMFSRGNIKEKARLLDFHSSSAEDSERTIGKDVLGRSTAVDLYAGIGYFVFSYVKMGIGRVIGWEMNPWSVEGLRRGARANGWDVKVVHASEELVKDDEKIVIVLEDNVRAGERLSRLTDLDEVLHVNCGLLPTGMRSWEMALSLVKSGAWLHLHENVGVHDISARQLEIEALFETWLRKLKSRLTAEVDHVELVKTFAPAVWHCVFDLYVTERRPCKS